MIIESKAEAMLQHKLGEWAGDISAGHASLYPVNEVIGAFSLALRPEKLRKLTEAGDDPEKLASLFDSAVINEMFEGEGTSTPQLAEAAELGEPMMDPSHGTEAASRPMDDARGEPATGDDPSVDAQAY